MQMQKVRTIMKFENLYDVMSYLNDEEQYQKAIGYVFNKLYEEAIEAQNNKNFMPLFKENSYFFNIDINKFSYYLFLYFIESEEIENNDYLNDNFLLRIRASFNANNTFEKQKKIFWLGFLGYDKGLVYVSKKGLDLVNYFYFSPIIFEHKQTGEKAKMLSITVSLAHLYKYFNELYQKIITLDFKKFQTSIAFGIKDVDKVEKRLKEKVKTLMSI